MKRMCIDQYLSIPEFGIYYIRRKLGVVKAILVENGQPVEYGQPLFVIG